MSVATLTTTSAKQERDTAAAAFAVDASLESVGRHTVRYGLVLVLLWIGAMKFTAYEAEAISGLVANSPLMAWAYNVFSTRQFAAVLGVTELLIAAMIAVRPFSARVSAVGSILAAGMFATTLTFLVSTPGVVVESIGFPAISVLPGQFLIKDIVLLGAAVWTAGEALRAARVGTLLKNAELKGYDPVAYFRNGTPTQGNVAYSSQYEGQTFYFASLENRDRFERESEKYLPQYGGYCAFGVAVGQLFDIDPTTGQVIDGKLYVNLNKKVLADFNKDAKGHIEQADKNWPDLKEKAA